jgi:hypothetical protein
MKSIDARAAAMRQDLLAMGAVSVSVEYDGYGDSGGIETVDIRRADTARVELDQRRHDALIELFYDLLEQRFGGWQDNYGSFGEFIWNLQTDQLHHVHNARFEDYETTTLDGWAEPSVAASATQREEETLP